MPGLLNFEEWAKSQGNRNWMNDWDSQFGGDGFSRIGQQMSAMRSGNTVDAYVRSQYDEYVKKQGAQDTVQKSQNLGDRMGLLGDALRDVNSSQNQSNLRNMSAQFNAAQPNYSEIAAAQGLGGSISGMQQEAAKRHAGLLTNANFGQMMGENNKTALGYYGQQSQAYGQAAQANQGLLSLDYQDKWKQAELKQQQAQFDEQNDGSLWNDLLNVGLGVGSAFLGNWAGAAGAAKGLGGGSKAGVPIRPSYDYTAPRQPLWTDQSTFGGYKVGGKWNPVTGQFE